MYEMKAAVGKMKAGRMSDELGLVAELLQHLPEDIQVLLLKMMNEVLLTGVVPTEWHRTLFLMLPKSASSRQPKDFRPIANTRVLYKLFAYLVLGRIEQTLDSAQPEEQHAFRSDRRIEEHLLTACLVIEKTLAANIPIWLVSLDLSKAFDRIRWPSLWQALEAHGVSKHLVWLLQALYHGQEGQVLGDGCTSYVFSILAGVRQGCVLSPRLFCAALEEAMKSWRVKVETLGYGVDLQDGGRCLLDLRFADDVLLFARSAEEASRMLEMLISELEFYGLFLNESKTVVMTTEAQPPQSLALHGGVTVKVLPQDSSHKWLGCKIGSGQSHHTDVEFHLQAATKAYYANKWILNDRSVPVWTRLQFFAAVVSPVACFAGCHRTTYRDDMTKLDVVFRRLARQLVGPPSGMDWSQPWHETLHFWHERLNGFLEGGNVRCWSEVVLRQYWFFAAYVVSLPEDRWVQSIALVPSGHQISRQTAEGMAR